MSCPMMTCLEPRDAARTGMATEEVLTLVAARTDWCGEPFAFDGKEGVKIDMSLAIHPYGRIAWSGHQINLPAGYNLVWLLRPEL